MGVKNPKVIRNAQRKRIQLETGLKPLLQQLSGFLEVSNSDIVSILELCPRLVARDPLTELAPTISLLCSLYGESGARVAARKNPNLLCVRVKKKKDTTAAALYLESLGIPASDFQDSRSHLLDLSVTDNIIPVWEYLSELLGDSEAARTAIKKFPQLLGLSVEDKLHPTALYLESLGMDPVAKAVLRYPQLLGISIEEKIKPTIAYLKDLGVHLSSGYLNRHPALLLMSLEANLKPKVTYFQSIGVDDVSKLFQHPPLFSLSVDNLKSKVAFLEGIGMRVTEEIVACPFLLGLSVEQNLLPKIDFLTSLGYAKSQFSGRHLLASLEQRIIPRSQYISSQGDKCPSLSILTISTDEEFCKSMKYSLEDFTRISTTLAAQLKEDKKLRLWIQTGSPMGKN